MYKLILSEKTKRELKQIPKRHEQAILATLKEILENPLAGKALTREFTGRFSYKVGVYRIIYQVNSQNKTIYISTAGHRKEVYKP